MRARAAIACEPRSARKWYASTGRRKSGVHRAGSADDGLDLLGRELDLSEAGSQARARRRRAREGAMSGKVTPAMVHRAEAIGNRKTPERGWRSTWRQGSVEPG
jgi:hypothetical protein